MVIGVSVLWLGVRFLQGTGWSPSAPDEHFLQVLDEVMAVENISRPPVPSSSGGALACIRNSGRGRSLFLVDLKTLQQTAVPLENDIRRMAGWSPGGRYLAFEQKPPFSERVLAKRGGRPLAEDLNEAWLTILDSRSNSARRLSGHRKVNEKWFVWLNERTCLFSVDSDDEELRANYWMDVETRALERVSDSLHDFVKMSEQKAAYVKEKNIWTFELTPSGDVPKKWGRPRQEKVSDFKAGDFDSLRWLRYSPENGCFLFCARQKNSAWRYLFRFDPRNKELTQLTHEDTYNGQWVDGGRGFAYVGNTNNSFFLALRCSLPHGRTNIFTRGSVANYVIAETGDRVFATASLGIEPQGIWEYDLRTGDLRTVLPGTTRSNVVCRWVEPQECRTVSFDGLEIPYFMISPVRPMATNGIQVSTTTTIGAKHPIIFYLPPQSYQFQRSFEARSQMMANLGFYFVAVNYRGCDGYGKAYSDLDDPTGAAKDVLAVVDEVCKLRSVDAGNMFLWTSSSGSAAAFELLAVAPERWRGAALISPTSWHDDARFRPKGFPAFLFTTGDQDGALPSLQEFKTWAANNGIEAKFVVVRDSGHITFNAAQVASNRKLVARFFIDHIEK